MAQMSDETAFEKIKAGFDRDPARSLSLRKEAYVAQEWYETDRASILAKSWQWVCHVEKLRKPGSYFAVEIAGQPIAIVRDRDGVLRAFYNVCKHRAHELLEQLEEFTPGDICLEKVQVAEIAGFVFVNLDPDAAPLSEVSGNLETEIRHWAPDIETLTFGHRLTYKIKSNWKNVVDNFLECYH